MILVILAFAQWPPPSHVAGGWECCGGVWCDSTAGASVGASVGGVVGWLDASVSADCDC